MNTKDLSGITIVKKNEIEKHCWEADSNFSLDQLKVVDKQSRLIPSKLKETMHSLKNSSHIKQNFLHASKIWLPNLR